MKKCFVFLFLIIGCSVFAQQIRINTVGCSITSDEVQEIKERLKFQKLFYAKLLKEIPASDISVKVFGNYADFSAYSSACCQMEMVTTAFLNVNKLEIVVFKNQEFIRSLSHELSHVLTINAKIDLHFWLSEGLSDLMASFKPDGMGGQKEEVLYLSKDLRFNEKSTKKLTRFLSINAEDWSSLSTYDSYGVAWALVNYLYKEDRILLREIVNAVERDLPYKPIIAARYKKGLKGFFQAVREYYSR